MVSKRNSKTRIPFRLGVETVGSSTLRPRVVVVECGWRSLHTRVFGTIPVSERK